METFNFLQWIGGIGGIGAIFGIIMLWIYRDTVKQIRVDRKFIEDRMTKLIDDYHTTCHNDQQIMVKHTQIMTELLVYLRAKNGH